MEYEKKIVIYLGLLTIFLYSIIKISGFYGINLYEYASYGIFYIFLSISVFLFVKEDPEINSK